MKLDDISAEKGIGISKSIADLLRQSLLTFLSPLLFELDELIDKRLVKTLYKTIEAIITLRHSSLGLFKVN